MSLLRRSNHEQIQLVKESGSYWLKITTCKHEKDTFIQDLFEISWFRLAIGALAPRFIPDRCRIRASSSRSRRAWLRQHIRPLVECGQKFISIDVPEETLKSIVSIENKDASTPLSTRFYALHRSVILRRSSRSSVPIFQIAG
jgi:hypothetical protein